MSATVTDLRAHGMLVRGDEGAVAVVTSRGWTQVPAPLAPLVLRALEGGDDAA